MLVVDSSSECDICFEPYGSKTPHSVPCGHVFCKECLDDLHDCPICREPFATEQVTKLHVDRQSGQPSNEINFLKRLILSMYDNSSSEKFSDIMEEAFAWLDSQPPDSNELLRSAWVVFSAYPVSKEKNGPDETFLELCRQLHESDRAYQAAKAEWDIKIAVAETEVSALRTENDQLRHLLRKAAAAGAELSGLRNENIKLRHDFDQKFSASETEISSLRSEITQLRNATTTSDSLATGSTASTSQPRAANLRPKKGYSQPKNAGPHDVRATGSGVPTVNLRPRSRKPVAKVKSLGPLDGKRAAIPTPQRNVTSGNAENKARSDAPVRAVALYDFEAQDPGDMSLTRDEIIEQIDQTTLEWWSGVGEGGLKTGLFPSNYVKIMEQPVAATAPPQDSEPAQSQPSASNGPRAVVLFEFEAVDDGDMSLRKGEVIHQIDQVEGGWWTGVGSDGSKRGLFPSNYVRILEQPDTTPLSPRVESQPSNKLQIQTQSPPSKGVCARVLYDYTALDDRDMQLVTGEIIEQIDQINDEWWSGVGASGSKSGLFPTNYVEIIDQPDDEQTSASNSPVSPSLLQKSPPSSKSSSVRPTPNRRHTRI